MKNKELKEWIKNQVPSENEQLIIDRLFNEQFLEEMVRIVQFSQREEGKGLLEQLKEPKYYMTRNLDQEEYHIEYSHDGLTWYSAARFEKGQTYRDGTKMDIENAKKELIGFRETWKYDPEKKHTRLKIFIL